MKRKNFTSNDIQVGDEVLINDHYSVEHNLFWRVVNKLSNNRLLVEIREMGYAEKFVVYVKDVVNLQKNHFSFS